MYKNSMEVKFKSISVNESFARVCISAFCVQLSPTIEELEDIKTAVSEAVTNCIVHAYRGTVGLITMKADIIGNRVLISIADNGIGINDIETARQPFFTTQATEERSGMGITVMESFMEKVEIKNKKSGGVIVTMEKSLQEKIKSVG